jgi:hypothetical protein
MIDLDNRTLIISTLLHYFCKTYDELLLQYSTEEKIYISDTLKKVAELHREYVKGVDISVELAKVNEDLYKTLRSKAVPFNRAQFHRYFDPNLCLIESGIVTAEEFNANYEKAILSGEEYDSFLQGVLRLITTSKTYIYMEDEPGAGQLAGAEPERKTGTETAEGHKEHTTARQVLAVHYMLRFLHSTAEGTVRRDFIHFLTGKNKDNIYKTVRSPLSGRSEQNLIEDLHFVRDYFIDLNLPDIIDAINADIEAAKEAALQKRRNRHN